VRLSLSLSLQFYCDFVRVESLILVTRVFSSFSHADLKKCELKDEDDRRKGDHFQLQVPSFSFPYYLGLVWIAN
jgi:hypothetical protein